MLQQNVLSLQTMALKSVEEKDVSLLLDQLEWTSSVRQCILKELDFVMSTSYGPGRYDKQYEIKGIDYPIGYVRWTENRNMMEFVRLLANWQGES